MSAPASHRADVADGRGERDTERGHVELDVVSEDADGVARPERAARQHRVGPFSDDLVGGGETLGGRERRARIDDRDVETDELRRLAELRGGMNRADHVENRRWKERLDEHVDV